MHPPDLSSLPLFGDLPADDRRRLLDRMSDVAVEAGQEIVEQGDLSYKFFVVIEGTASVRRDGVEVAELGPGDFFGETGILDRARRNAGVVAETPMRLGMFVSWDIRELMDRHPSFRDRVEAAHRSRTG